MKRIKLIAAYDGTAYHGWQFQPNAPTIEGELNRSLKELLHEEIQVIGGSRTDSGVHALCNVAVFDTNSRIPSEKFKAQKKFRRGFIPDTAPAGRLMNTEY